MANRCFICGEEEEIVDHLLIHCSKVRILWDLLLVIFGVSWVFLLSSFLVRFFCGKALQEGMDGSSPLHFFGQYGGKETYWF